MRTIFGPILSGATAIAFVGGASPAAAQSGESISRPVVQPLPPPSVSDLGEALRRLARNARDVDALIDAGNASLKLNDIDAAIGFFGRAQELSPENPRVKLGLAGAFVRSRRPIEALRLFEEAERGGVSTTAFASARGLAYDLVGDNAAAQAQYRKALAAGEDDVTIRRLAISQAIAGDREGFEKTLYPQLAREDYAGFRTRAFGLAILGDEEEAVAIAETVMPPELSEQIAPYLRYMRRLTKAQQAAAVNLGVFPRAAQIGRDSPRIAQYNANSSARTELDARLTPSGEPLGAGGEAEEAEPTAPRVASAARAGDTSGELPPVAQGNAPQTVVSRPVVQPVPDSPPAQVATAAPVESPQPQPAQASAEPTQPPQTSPEPTRIALAETSVPAPGFDLAALAPTAAPPERAPVTTDTGPPPSVADAFATFKLGPAPTFEKSAGAVDITLIEPPREVEKEEPPAEPEPPAHPKRFWVQVATGRNVDAFKYDWRRISDKAPEILGDFEPMTTPWVEANRLLAGPYETEEAAEEAVDKLHDAGVDSFTFTSEEGQEIVPLP